MDKEKLKQDIFNHNKAVQDELVGFAKGTEQALGWVIGRLQQEEPNTVDTGKTVIVDQEK